MKIRVTHYEEVLGSASADPELHAKWIASKSMDAEKMKEEMEGLSDEERHEKKMTVFHKDADGNPFVWDYQWKGFFKEQFGTLTDVLLPKQVMIGKTKLTKYTYKRVVDRMLFVFPRKIKLNMPEGGEIGTCQRPLRADTPRGERVALATSESVPAGTTVEIEIECLRPELNELVVKSLNLGKMAGWGQWRNSGKGRFTWEEIE